MMGSATTSILGRAWRDWQPLRGEAGMLGFGLLHAMASGLGQTFFVSLFVPHWLESVGLQRTAFSAMYSGATVGAALLLPWVGRGIDRLPLGRYALLVSLGLALACVGLSLAESAAWLLGALLLLRLCGQGLMSHTGSTATARHFLQHRGKALSIVSLGYPISETVFPLVATAAIAVIGWRQTWLAAAGCVIVLVLPATQALLRRSEEAKRLQLEPGEQVHGRHSPRAESWTQADVVKSVSAWLLMPLLFMSAFVLTGLFFHQLELARAQGWTPTWLAASFTAFGVARALSGLGVGPLIDRFGPATTLRLHLIPLGVGVSLIALSSAPWTAPVYLGMAGLTMGSGGASRTAFVTEVFGVRHLGAIRSTLGMLGVLSTAAAPILFGWALDAGWPFAYLSWASVGCVVAASLVGSSAIRRLQAQAAA